VQAAGLPTAALGDIAAAKARSGCTGTGTTSSVGVAGRVIDGSCFSDGLADNVCGTVTAVEGLDRVGSARGVL
jgi:hypothetical protein